MKWNKERQQSFIASIALTIIFTIMKVMGIISWDWVWIVSPFWLSGLFFGIVWVIFKGFILR